MFETTRPCSRCSGAGMYAYDHQVSDYSPATVRKERVCSECDGKGVEYRTEKYRCSDCNGTGEETVASGKVIPKTAFGPARSEMVQQQCRRCFGRGEFENWGKKVDIRPYMDTRDGGLPMGVQVFFFLILLGVMGACLVQVSKC